MKKTHQPETQSIKSDALTYKNILVITGILLVIFVCVVVWIIPRSSEDIFISLAAGRDIMSGRLAAPDDWSFTTENRVWLNQNWGADVLFYLTQSFLGENGLVVLKLIILLLSVFFLVLTLREIRIPLFVSLPVAAAVLISMSMYLILRPYFFALLFIPLLLWLLYKTKDCPAMMWIIAGIIILWANIHASFIYGLGIVFLWVLCAVVPDIISREWGLLKKKSHLIGGALAALLLAGFANPFGLKNLAFPFMMVPDGAWQKITDWRPLWETVELRHYRISIFCFFAVIAAALVLLVFRGGKYISGYSHPDKGKSKPGKEMPPSAHRGIIIFEIILSVITIMMAVTANRFIIIALVAIAPLLSRQIAWFVSRFRNSWVLPAVMNCILFVYAGLIAADTLRNYDPENPVMNTGTGSLFEKMHYVNAGYDGQLVKFINTNRISGNIFIPWDWEGYLRWKCPSLKVFIGGRAQQIYDIETFDKYLYITGADVRQYQGQKPVDILEAADTHLFLVRNGTGEENTIRALLDDRNWAIVYADESYILFADTGFPETNAVVEQLEGDRLVFGNDAIAAMSKAASLSSQPQKWEAGRILELYNKAFIRKPIWPWGYRIFFDTYSTDPAMYVQGTTLLETQLRYFSIMKQKESEAILLLYCRMYVADTLAKIASNAGADDVAAGFREEFSKAEQAYLKLQKKWKLLVIN